jgi:hypothetical protein
MSDFSSSHCISQYENYLVLSAYKQPSSVLYAATRDNILNNKNSKK